MALSQVQVVNLALTKLGQDRVTSIDDDIEAARVMRSLWDFTRDAVLASFPWKFAIVSADLPAVSFDATIGLQGCGETAQLIGQRLAVV